MDVNAILSTNEAKVNFLLGLVRVANSDGIQDLKELQFYQQTAAVLGLTTEEIERINKSWNDPGSIEITFETGEQKMFFFVEAIQLCWIDGVYTDSERNEVNKLAEELGISSSAINSVEDWVLEGMEWNKRGDSLLSLR